MKKRLYIVNKEDVLQRINKYSKSSGYCLEWQGTKNKTGLPYGRMKLEGKMWLVHRLVAHYYLGLDLFNIKIEACHSCDNPRCINHKHIFLASHSENIADSVKKKRYPRNYGEKNQFHKLTTEQVNYIKKYGNREKTFRKIANEFGVSRSTVWCVHSGKYRIYG